MTAHGGTRAALGVLSAAAAVGAWRYAAAVDRRAIEQDPEWDVLAERPKGRVLPVEAADGVTLHAEVFGDEDAPPVVLIHGWTCAIRFWTYQLRALRAHHRVIAYDLRGHGLSEAPKDHDLSLDSLADDLQAVLDAALKPGEKAILAGHSLGAMSIVSWAGRHPERLAEHAAAVALINTGIGDLISESVILPTPTALGRVKSTVGSAVLSTHAPIPPGSPVTARALRYIALSPHASPGQVAMCQELVLDCRRDVRAAYGRAMAGMDLWHALEHIRVPALVIGGKLDKMTPLTHVERLARELREVVEVVELERAGHMGPIEAHAEVTAAVERLSASVEDRVRPVRPAA